MTHAKTIEKLAQEIADEVGLKVRVQAFNCARSEKLGAQVRVRVFSPNKRQTWSALRSLGRLLAERGAGRVFVDRDSHYETRTGVTGSCQGWATGSAADLRVYPESAS